MKGGLEGPIEYVICQEVHVTLYRNIIFYDYNCSPKHAVWFIFLCCAYAHAIVSLWDTVPTRRKFNI